MSRIKLLLDVVQDMRSLADSLQAVADAVADSNAAGAEMTTTKEPEETGKAGKTGKSAKNTAKKDAKAAKLEPEEKRRLLERNDGDMTDNDYSMIMAIVNQGFSEDVMNAARPMGASGGTVFHSRRVGNEQAMKFWKISVQEEREVVIILAKKEDKLAIMQEIGKKCGMHSQAQGIVMSLPVDNVMGLE